MIENSSIKGMNDLFIILKAKSLLQHFFQVQICTRNFWDVSLNVSSIVYLHFRENFDVQ